MTFKEWENTPEGEESFENAVKWTNENPGTYIDNLMWSDYKASDHWQYDQYPAQYKNDKVKEK